MIKPKGLSGLADHHQKFLEHRVFHGWVSEHGLKLSNLILEMAVEVGRMMMHWILDPASGAHHSLARKITPRPKTNTLCLSVWNPSQDNVLTQASWPTAKKQWYCRRLVSMGTSMKQWTNSNHPLPIISPHIAT